MLGGNGNKNSKTILTIGLIQQKNQLCTCGTLFCTFLCSCCSNVKLPSHTFYEENVVCAEKKLLLVFLFAHFHLAGHQHFSLPLQNFHVVLPTKFVSFVFHPSLQLSNTLFLVDLLYPVTSFSFSLSFSIFQICGHCN